MDTDHRPRSLPVRPLHAPGDLADGVDLAEVEAAVALVRSGGAARIRLTGLRDAAGIAGVAAARAQAAGLAFRLDPPARPSRAASLTIGPRT